MLVETLETRRLMSASLNAATGVLSMVGTPGPDTMTADVVAGSLVVKHNVFTTSFPLAAVKSITVDAGAGPDDINIGASVFLPTRLYSGSGPWDQVRGGSGPDVIYLQSSDSDAYGGNGPDVLMCGLDTAGQNDVYGGRGNDRFLVKNAGGTCWYDGEDGTDTIDYSQETSDLLILNEWSGEYALFNNKPVPNDVADHVAGFENLVGGGGNDYIFGTDGPNVLTGNRGSDRIFAAGGNDILTGGSGSDFLYGEAGNDLLMDKDLTADFVSGGTGSDTAQVDASDLVSGVEVVVA